MAGTSVDIRKLNRLLEEFRLLTGIRISFWNAAGQRCAISDTPADSSFCAMLREKPELEEACRQCDAEGIRKARETGTLCKFVCHAGLHEYVYPVVESGQVIGFFMIGQVSMPEAYGDIVGQHREIWRSYGLDEEKVRAALEELPVMTHDKMIAACHMLEALAKYVYIKELVRRTDPPLCQKVKDYIRDHLDERFTLDGIAAAKNMSRSTLCHTVRSDLNLSVVELINRIRIERVQELLREGKSLQEAALESGFSSAGYCSRVYRQVMGRAPSAADRKKEMNRL